jgi:hypothetical protein
VSAIARDQSTGLDACSIGYRWGELQIPPRHAGTGRLRSEVVTFLISFIVGGRKALKSIGQ